MTKRNMCTLILDSQILLLLEIGAYCFFTLTVVLRWYSAVI